MGKKKAGFYAALVWLARNPMSTAYEVCRGIGFSDPWRVFEWLMLAEKQGMVSWYRINNELTPRWKANVNRVPEGPVGRSSSGSDTSGHG